MLIEQHIVNKQLTDQAGDSLPMHNFLEAIYNKMNNAPIIAVNQKSYSSIHMRFEKLPEYE